MGDAMTEAGACPTVALVAMAVSIHTARWVAMIRDAGLRIVIVPVTAGPPVEELRPYRLVSGPADLRDLAPGEIGIFDVDGAGAEVGQAVDEAAGFRREAHPAFPESFRTTSASQVATALRVLQPDLVHSMEVQLAGYLMLEASRRLGRACPPWLLSNWGSDVYLFRKLDRHRPILERIFRRIDGYWAECGRDVGIARDFGFSGLVCDPIPASGGMDMSRLRMGERPSARRTILVKGYHGWAGRGMHILSALHLAAPRLRDYAIRVIFPLPSMVPMLDRIREEGGLDIEIEPHVPSHAEAMDRLARARMVVGLGISDGISTTLLEAMAVGAFPVLADTSCACEWIRNGTDGMIVGPHDTGALAEAIVRAATDDALIDAAAIRNRAEVERRWDAAGNGPAVLEAYRRMIRLGQERGGPWASRVTV